MTIDSPELTQASSIYDDMQPGDLAEGIVTMLDSIGASQRMVQDMQAAMLAKIRAAGGTALPHDTYKIAIENGAPSYDLDVLKPLLESAIPQNELDKAYAPEHPESRTVPAKWHGGQLNVLERKYGGAIAETIRAARIPGSQRLVVEEK
jgi:hypothetical protein